MPGFYFSKFIFTIKGESTLFLPAYKGSTIRGGFGHAFRRIVCVSREKECSACLLKQQCIYSWVFETPVPPDARIVRKYSTAPHPFIIEPPMDEQTVYQANDEISFGLILIGRAIDYLPYFIYAFDELGRIGIGRGKGNYQLVRVSEAISQKVLYQGHDKMLRAPGDPVRWEDIACSSPPDHIRLFFLTPTRIKYNDGITRAFEFHALFRGLLRRISLLSYFHCGHRLDDRDFKDLIEQAKEIKTVKQTLSWEDWERYFNRQKTHINMGGIIGEITYEGDFTPFWPYVKLGEYVHVGKGSSLGLGKYALFLPDTVNSKAKDTILPLDSTCEQ